MTHHDAQLHMSPFTRREPLYGKVRHVRHASWLAIPLSTGRRNVSDPHGARLGHVEIAPSAPSPSPNPFCADSAWPADSHLAPPATFAYPRPDIAAHGLLSQSDRIDP